MIGPLQPFVLNLQKGLRGGVLMYAAQEIPLIDAEIPEKGHLWMETK